MARHRTMHSWVTKLVEMFDDGHQLTSAQVRDIFNVNYNSCRNALSVLRYGGVLKVAKTIPNKRGGVTYLYGKA